MHKTIEHRTKSLKFRQWSRKNYAIFSSLGKEINIGHVDIDICDKASEKGVNRNSVLIHGTDSFQSNNEDLEEISVINSETELISLLSITSNSDISSRHCRNSILNKSFSIILFHPDIQDASTYFNILKNDKYINDQFH